MSQIFISYARADTARVKQLVSALSGFGWSVWCDQEILPGQNFRKTIENELDSAESVIVVWSKGSVESSWVYSEAERARIRGVLLPVLFDPVEQPLGFRPFQTADMSDWTGKVDHPGFELLVKALIGNLGEPRIAWTGRRRGTRDTDLLEAEFRSGLVVRDPFESGDVGPELVVIPAGHFRMGDTQGDTLEVVKNRTLLRTNTPVYPWELPVRTVHISRPFLIGRFPITFEEYDRFARATNHKIPGDSGFGRGQHPAINVSWVDAVAYVKWLTKETGRWYRLPSEAEWEYAARGGTNTTFWWGQKFEQNRANCLGRNTSCASTHLLPAACNVTPIGSFTPNPFGLFDTAGHVWEWVADRWNDNCHDAPEDGTPWMQGDRHRRVIRGGSWATTPENVRSSNRFWAGPDFRDFDLGFRICADLLSSPLEQ